MPRCSRFFWACDDLQYFVTRTLFLSKLLKWVPIVIIERTPQSPLYTPVGEIVLWGAESLKLLYCCGCCCELRTSFICQMFVLTVFCRAFFVCTGPLHTDSTPRNPRYFSSPRSDPPKGVRDPMLHLLRVVSLVRLLNISWASQRCLLCEGGVF